jgi:hypothetical protein
MLSKIIKLSGQTIAAFKAAKLVNLLILFYCLILALFMLILYFFL